MSVRALVLQQQEDVPAALFERWAQARDVALTIVRADLLDELPVPESVDFALALGSDESVREVSTGWVARELEWLQGADRCELPVLGICFGAQALAVALGGSVRRAACPEIGWVSIGTDAPELVGAGPWFTWHEDCIELPGRAVEVARNDVGVQAFAVGSHLGVQFHPEVTRAVVAAWAGTAGGARQLADAALDAELLARDGRLDSRAVRADAFRLFDAFAARVLRRRSIRS